MRVVALSAFFAIGVIVTFSVKWFYGGGVEARIMSGDDRLSEFLIDEGFMLEGDVIKYQPSVYATKGKCRFAIMLVEPRGYADAAWSQRTLKLGKTQYYYDGIVRNNPVRYEPLVRSIVAKRVKAFQIANPPQFAVATREECFPALKFWDGY